MQNNPLTLSAWPGFRYRYHRRGKLVTRHPLSPRIRPGGPKLHQCPPWLLRPGLSGLGLTLHSTASAKYNEAQALYDYFNNNLAAVPDAGARESWRSVIAANYRLLADAYTKLEAGDDTESFDLSNQVIGALGWQRQNFDADLHGRTFEQAKQEEQAEVQRLTTQVSEEEEQAAQAEIVQYGAYKTGKAAAAAVGGAAKGLFTGLGAGGSIVLIVGVAVAAYLLLKR